MSDIIFWSGFCFGVAITTGFYGVFWLIVAIRSRIKKLNPCKDCPYYDDYGEM